MVAGSNPAGVTMLTEQEIQEEIELITKIISHPAGYDVDLFGTFCVRPTDQGVWEVDWVDGNNKPEYKTFDTAKEAAEYFVRLRIKDEIGIDFEYRE